ncbi:MAG: hypothetical protein EOP04_09505 [Proteobacteria bacterium]|nr:MAG: hypothetical protein EOP04_09505 [Pseudomonadota bacterium]
MIDKGLYFISKNLKTLLIIVLLVFGGGAIYLSSKWKKDATTFGDNILIEFVIGGLFLVVPVLLGVYVGKKSKELQFYTRMKTLLATISSHRKKGDIQQEATRNIVIEFSDALGEGVLDEDWLKNVIRKDWLFDEKECGVCGLRADVVNEKCKHCKLDCFAWQA